ncbi:hypothetical protein GCM10009563_15690 [Subtercola frigoramans]
MLLRAPAAAGTAGVSTLSGAFEPGRMPDIPLITLWNFVVFTGCATLPNPQPAVGQLAHS